jgi:diguanylate cyclase
VTASIGVAVSPPGFTARELIERADRALYQAKRSGKNRVSRADDLPAPGE